MQSFAPEVDELIQETLETAKTTMGMGDMWHPFIHIIHPAGIETIRVDGMSSGEKNKLANVVDSRLSVLKGTAAIMLADLCIGSFGECEHVAGQSLDSPTDREQALLLAVWGPNMPTAFGVQIYEAGSSGEMMFHTLEWIDAATASLLRLALTNFTSHWQVSVATRGER